MWRIFLLLFILNFPCTLHAFFWPLSWEFEQEKRFLGPLISYQNDEENTGITVRPLLSSYDSRDGGEWNFIYPLGKSNKEKSYFVPIYLSKSMAEGESDTAFTFLFWGKSKQGRYFGFFPFFGTMYDRFGADELGFLAWPIYSYKTAEGATKRNFLYPFFATYSGAETGFKAWPLYGTRERMGEKKTTFFLWPFFVKQQRDLDTDEPIDALNVTPFYMSAVSRKRASYSIMWPIYSYQKDEDKVKHGFFFNLFSKTEGSGETGYSYFPFISSVKKENDTTLDILWPLYKETEYYIENDRYLYRRILLWNRYLTEKGRTFLSVWPFFEYRKEKDEHTVYIPTVLPYKEAGWDRIARPLLTLYEQRTGPDRSAVSVLYGLFTNEKKGEDWKTRFAFLLEVKKEKGHFGFEFLSGLLGMDKTHLKILFIPFKKE
ncbi:MAG: hypothetical protein C0392_05505 [Syntrophus sp. (in: bacteria)]|nr:hypothetical protein [Syntrophus sp. (in: bacteria)]